MIRRTLLALGVPRAFLGNARIGDWMQTRGGRAFYPLDPRAHEVNIDDIAFALSNLCRFGGHVPFYSVAEHSVLCSYVVPPEDAFAALMHDATEAYTVDVPRPLKVALRAYARIEARVWRAIADRFGLPYALPASVKAADNAVLLDEKAQLLGRSPMPWSVPGERAGVRVIGLDPSSARQLFMSRYRQLAPLHRARLNAVARPRVGAATVGA